MERVYPIGQVDYVSVVEKGEIKTKRVQRGNNNRVCKGRNNGDALILNPLPIFMVAIFYLGLSIRKFSTEEWAIVR